MKYTLIMFFLVLNLPIHSQTLIFNEVLASNDSLMTDSFGDYDDWLEIHNTTNTAINLNGYKLYDDPNITAWFFPDTVIEPFGYIVIWTDDQLFQNTNGWNSDMHANFKIDKDGETVYFKDPSGNLIDTISWSNLPTDTAWARIPNATGPFTLTTNYTFGSNNTPPVSSNTFETQIQTHLFPNPSKGLVFFNIDFADLEIYDSLGNLVHKEENFSLSQLDLTFLKRGNYFLKFTNKERTTVTKLIKT